jgi:hypothetical protein
MSNPTTNYIVEGADLATIFMPLEFGDPIGYDTSYNVSGYGDLSTIFASLSSGISIGYDTNYIVNGIGDLSTIFASYNSKAYYITNPNTYISYTYQFINGYNVLTFTVPYASGLIYKTGTCDVIFTNDLTINCIVVGGGGSGGASYGLQNGAATGGGGAGGEINIGMKGINAGGTYSLQVGSGGTIYTNPGQDGIESFFKNIIASGGNQGENANTLGIPGAGGISINGGNGGDGVEGAYKTNVYGTAGDNSSYNSYTTEYGTTYALGGGGGSGACTTTNQVYYGNGYGGDGNGGARGNYSVYNNNSDGVSYGSGGGSGGAINTGTLSSASGGLGGPGLVILYWPLFTVSNTDSSYYSYTYSNGYCVLTFLNPNSSETTVTNTITFNQYVSNVNMVVVGGGGGGGDNYLKNSNFTYYYGGGGGAGGSVSQRSKNVTGNTSYTITVGYGGAGGSGTGDGYNGNAGGASSIVGGSINIDATGGKGGYSPTYGGQGGNSTGLTGDGGNGGYYLIFYSYPGITGPPITLANDSTYYFGGGGSGGIYYTQSSPSSYYSGGAGGGGGSGSGVYGNAGEAYTGPNGISYAAGSFSSGTGWSLTGGGGAGGNGTSSSYKSGKNGATGIVVISFAYP